MIRMKIPRYLFDQVQSFHREGTRERLSFLFGRRVDSDSDTVILVPEQRPWLLDDDCFKVQGTARVKLDAELHLRLLADFAATDFDVLVDIHNHPFSERGTGFSGVDDADNLAQARYLESTLADHIAEHHPDRMRPLYSASLVFDRTSLAARMTSTYDKRPFEAIESILVLGEHLERIIPNNAKRSCAPAEEAFSRQRDFISDRYQSTMRELRIGLVGCGGLGAILAEQLRRLGFSRLTLVDDDSLEESNLNRWQTGCLADVGGCKPSILAGKLHEMLPGPVSISVVEHSVFTAEAIDALKTCDVILGAVDNHAARYTLNRLCTQYLIPYLDTGVVIYAKPEVDFQHRLFTMVPGETSCMECTRFALMDFDSIDQAFADPMSYRLMRAHGYIKNDSDASAPSVYPLNTLAAGTLMTELLNLVCGFRPLARLVYGDFREGTSHQCQGPSFVEPSAESCPNCSFYNGRGDSEAIPVPTAYQDSRALTEAVLADLAHSGKGGATTQRTERDAPVVAD